MLYRIAYPSELYHHGIKGQKWHLRRYQNYDGTLTSAGKERYRRMYDIHREKGGNTAYNELYDRISSSIGSEKARAIHNKWNEEVNSPLNTGDYIDKLSRRKRREYDYLSDAWSEARSNMDRDRRTFEDEYRSKHKFARLLSSRAAFDSKARAFSSKKVANLPSTKEFNAIDKKYGKLIDSVTADLRNKTMSEIMQKVPDYAKDDVYDLIRFYMWDYA